MSSCVSVFCTGQDTKIDIQDGQNTFLTVITRNWKEYVVSSHWCLTRLVVSHHLACYLTHKTNCFIWEGLRQEGKLSLAISLFQPGNKIKTAHWLWTSPDSWMTPWQKPEVKRSVFNNSHDTLMLLLLLLLLLLLIKYFSFAVCWLIFTW